MNSSEQKQQQQFQTSQAGRQGGQGNQGSHSGTGSVQHGQHSQGGHQTHQNAKNIGIQSKVKVTSQKVLQDAHLNLNYNTGTVTAITKDNKYKVSLIDNQNHKIKDIECTQDQLELIA